MHIVFKRPHLQRVQKNQLPEKADKRSTAGNVCTIHSNVELPYLPKLEIDDVSLKWNRHPKCQLHIRATPGLQVVVSKHPLKVR